MYCGKFDPKREVCTFERDNDTDRLQKSVYIYTFVFTGTYTGPFCHNPVESSGMDAFLQESVGIKKYSKIPTVGDRSLINILEKILVESQIANKKELIGMFFIFLAIFSNTFHSSTDSGRNPGIPEDSGRN